MLASDLASASGHGGQPRGLTPKRYTAAAGNTGREGGILRFRFSGWAFWLIALFPWLRVGEVGPGLAAGDPINFAEAILDICILLIGAAFLVGRFAQPAVELSPETLSFRIFPLIPFQTIELSKIARINWVSGSTIGLKLLENVDVSVNLILVSKPSRSVLVEALKKHLASPSAT